MDTFPEFILKLYNWFLEYLETNNIEKQEINKNIENIEDEATLYIYEEIMSLYNLDREEFNNIVSLLSLEYYNMIYVDEEEPDEIVELIEKSSKADFIDELLDDECDYLFDMICKILNLYRVGYSISLDYMFSEDDYNYEYMEYVCSTENGKVVYKEYHPNILRELDKLNKFEKELKIEEMIDKVKINSLFSYLYYLTTFRPILNNDLRLKQKFFEKLMEIDDKKIYDEILNYIVTYFYLMSNKNDLNENKIKLLNSIKNNKIKEELENMSISNLMCLLDSFINYDFIKYEERLNNSSEDEKQIVKKININTKNK